MILAVARISGFEGMGNVVEGIAYADGATATATQINDDAFAILNQLNARSDSKSNPVLGAVAIFAGDAHSLSHALTSGDRAGAAGDLATLEADRGAVDSALISNPGMVSAADWKRIKGQMAALSKQLGPIAPASRPSSGSTSAARSDSPPSTATDPVPAPVASTAAPVPSASAPSVTSGSAPTSAGPALAEPPKVVIESRTIGGSSIRVKGYLEGTDLKRGGIYASSRQLRDFKLGKVAGEQRLNFDLGVESPKPDAMIRVYDADGRMAEASIVGSGDALASSRSDSSAPADSAAADATRDSPEIPQLPNSADMPSKHAPSVEGGVEVFRNSAAANDDAGKPNTAEIPSHGTPHKSPSKRHTLGSNLANVQINISAANQIAVSPPTFELVGQIVGRGITRAGIYDGNRLLRPITVEFGEDATNFDEKFVSSGSEARIRAYGVGDQFVESSVDLSSAIASAPADPSMNSGYPPPGTTYGGPTVGINSGSGILVQIAAVGPITSNLYVVSGVISGRRLSGAGLYQNGMLMQKIPINGGGIGGVLGALIPGASQNVNFNVRFNPQAGPATIGAFDSSGAYNEQPIVIAGINSYGGSANSYGGTPYGANRYGNSYGTNPYGSYPPGMTPARPNPYAGGTFGAPPISPLLPPTNPFGPPPGSSTSW